MEYIHKRRRAGGCSPPKMGRNPFHSGKFTVRTIGNSGNFSACSPALFDISGREFTASLSLKPSYAHEYIQIFVNHKANEQRTRNSKYCIDCPNVNLSKSTIIARIH